MWRNGDALEGTMPDAKPPIGTLGENVHLRLNQHEDANLLRGMQPAKVIDFNDTLVERVNNLRWRAPRDGPPSPQELSRVHKYIFGNLYPQAGNYRGIRTNALSQDISSAMGARAGRRIAAQITELFDNLKRQRYLVGTPKEEMVWQLANTVRSINEIEPFYNGTRLASLVIANHIAQYARNELDLFSTGTIEMQTALTAMRDDNDLIPLRQIMRDRSRPWKAIAFDKLIKAGDLLAIRNHVELGHAYSLVSQAIRGDDDHATFSYENLPKQQKAVIHKVQAELEAGRLNKMPSGTERAWYFGMEVARGR